MKIIIEEDKFQNMLYINSYSWGERINLFNGNYDDFDRSGESFKKLFEKLNIETNLIQIEDDE